MARSKNYSVKATISAVDKFTAPLRQLSGNIRHVTRGITGMVTGVTGKLAGLAGAMGLYVGVSQMKSALDAYVGRAGEIGDMATQLGLSAKALQELQFAAARSDVDVSAFTQSMNIFSRSLGQARIGTGTLKTWLDKMPASFRQQIMGARSTDAAFELMVGAISKIENPADKAAAAAAAFGRTGMTMTRMAVDGLPGLRKLREEAARYGLVSDEAGNAADAFGHAQARLKMALQGVANQVGASLIPILKGVTDRMTAWVVANRDVIASKLTRWIDRVVEGVKSCCQWINKNKTAIKDFASVSLDKVSSALGFIKDHFDDILSAAKIIFGIWLTIKAVTVCQGIATAVGLISASATALVTTLGGASGIAAMGAAFTAWLGPLALVAAALAGLVVTARSLTDLIDGLQSTDESLRQTAISQKMTDAGQVRAGIRTGIDVSGFEPIARVQRAIAHANWQTTGRRQAQAEGTILPQQTGLLPQQGPVVDSPLTVPRSQTQQIAVGGGLTINVKQDGSIRVSDITATNSRVPVRVVQETGARTPGLVTQ